MLKIRSTYRLRIAIPCVAATALLFSFGNVSGEEFRLECDGLPSPLAEIHRKDLEIDQVCGVEGNAGSNTRKRLENLGKNNFCATGGPITITYNTFKTLQKRSDDRRDEIKAALKESRSVLAKMTTQSGKEIGEGTLVRFGAFIHQAKYSNVGKKKPPKKPGESVNCNHPDPEFNDIHIELVMDPDEDDLCKSVTAEISPHFRPAAWDELVRLRLHRRPVRVTGPLFFDSGHQACRPGKRASPPRISIWEIHPVYAVDVCVNKTLKSCSAQDGAKWIPLHQWISEAEEEEDNG